MSRNTYRGLCSVRCPLPLALDCCSLAGTCLARTDRSLKGWKKDKMGGKQRRVLTAMPLNDRELVEQTDNSHLAYLAKSTFHLSSSVLSTFFFFFLNMIWKLAPVVSKSVSTLALIVTAGREVNISRQGRKRNWVLSHLGPLAVESSENKKVKKDREREREGEKEKRRATGQEQLREGREAMAGSTKDGSPSVFQLH